MKMLKRVVAYINHKFCVFLEKKKEKRRKKYLLKQRKLLSNNSLSLISNNCNGGVLLHELGLRFNSQFVNLFLYASDYIKYLENFDYYNSLKLSFDKQSTESYPVGKLEDIRIHFVHYSTEQEAEVKWEERKQRIDKNNLFVMFTEQKECTAEIVERFDKLPFKNKVMFTYNEYKNLPSTIYLENFKDNPLGVNMFFEFKKGFSSKRKYDVFDFVSWFNGEQNLKKLRREK